TGRLQNLGPASPGIEGRKLRGVNTDHAGGLVFTAGGKLLFSVSRTRGAGASGRVATIKKMDLESGEVEVLGDLVDETGVEIAYISRAVRIGPRDLVMGVVGRIPTGIVHVKLDEELANGPYQETQRRYWG
ncbi:MAG: hypothetical protein KGZ25_05035, partial [Planctomycetes bacterium]|nr:hypothetical protein [Planctomycetota bacterium]